MRARSIKPGFFKNYDLADAGPLAQLLFAGLWCAADKEGRIEDKPRRLKAEIFPYYDCDVNGELTVIERLGFIRRYVAHEIAVIEILNFKKHQSPHHTEKASELPSFEESLGASDCKINDPEIHGELTVNSRLENGGNPPSSLTPSSLTPDKETLLSESKEISPDGESQTPEVKNVTVGQAQAATAEPAEQTKKRQKLQPKTRIREDFVPPDKWGDFAASKGFSIPEIADMWQAFRDHHLANASAFADWFAAWRKWVNNQIIFNQRDAKRGLK